MRSRSFGTWMLAIPSLLGVAAVAHALGSYQGDEVKGGGSITGAVVFKGERPALAPFKVSKDGEHCGAQDKPNERLILSDKGEVANAVVYLVDIRKGKKLQLPQAKLDQKSCRYDPHVQIAEAGSKIAISSSDNVLHNVRAFDAANFNRPFPSAGVTLEEKLRKRGVVRVQCDNGHYWMSAYVHVVEHPYYAITDSSGKFTLTDVPAGNYKIAMWHEHWKETGREKDPATGAVKSITYADPIVVEKSVTVKAGEAAALDFDLTGN